MLGLCSLTTLCLLAAPVHQQKQRSSPAKGASAANTSSQSRKRGCISSLLKPALQLFAWESHSNITNNKETAWIWCHFCSHLVSPAAHWAHYFLFCPHSLMVILHPWPLHCFLLCTCSHHISAQTILFQLRLLWSILDILAFPPRLNFQAILWACCVLNSLQLCLLETRELFI